MLSKRAWLVISGIQWLVVGVMLLVKGLRYLIPLADQLEAPAPLLQWLVSMAGSRQQAALLIVSVALLIGFIKGRTVLAKSVNRMADRIQLQEGRLTLAQVYDKRYYLVLLLMVGLGFTLRALHLPHDIHGGIDVAIGAALINGGMLYFRRLYAPQQSKN